MNIIESQKLVQELRQENELLSKTHQQIVITGITSMIGVVLIGFRWNINPLYIGCVEFLVLCIAIVYRNVIKNNIKMNNFMIVLVHSCIQSEFNSDYHPGNDEIIQNRDLVN